MSSSGGSRGGGSLTWPLALGTDESFQPTGVASNTLTLHNPAAAVNGITLNGAATGATPSIAATGTDANVGINLVTKGTGALLLNGAAGAAGQALSSNGAGAAPTWQTVGVTWPLTNAGDETFQPNGIANNVLTLHNQVGAVDGLQIIAGSPTQLNAIGTDGNVGLSMTSKGNGQVYISTGGTGASVLLGIGNAVAGQVPLTATGVSLGVNGITVTNGATGNAPSAAATGADANVGLNISSKGSGTINLQSPSGLVTISAGNSTFDFAGYPQTIPAFGLGFSTNGVGDLQAISATSTFAVRANTGAKLALQATANTNAVNSVQISANATGQAPVIAAVGGDANVDLTLSTVGSGLINFGYAVTALGGGAAPTLGTIGGSGPAAAAQNSWLAVKINGTTSFLPVWR